MWGPNFARGRAVGGVDIALHDLRGKALGLSVAELYGGRVRNKIMGYAAAMNYVEDRTPRSSIPRKRLSWRNRLARHENPQRPLRPPEGPRRDAEIREAVVRSQLRTDGKRRLHVARR